MLSPDVTGYLASAGEFLRSRPAEHTVLLTVSEAVRTGGPATFGDDPPLFGWYAPEGGPVTAACLHTPPYPVALTAMPDPAAGALARALAGSGRAVTAVGGPPGPAWAFAAEWQRQTGQPARVGRHERLYRLGELRPPDPAPARVPVQLIVPTRDRFISPSYYADAERFAPRVVRRTVAARHWIPHSDPGVVAEWVAEFVEEVEAG